MLSVVQNFTSFGKNCVHKYNINVGRTVVTCFVFKITKILNSALLIAQYIYVYCGLFYCCVF